MDQITLNQILARYTSQGAIGIEQKEDGSIVLQYAESAFVGLSQEEVDRKLAEIAKQNYVELRAPAYPSIGDQLDAMWKGGADADAMRAKIMAIKAKYPKGE